MKKGDDEVLDILSKLLYFTGIETTRKVIDSKYKLIKTKNNIYYAQKEADILLGKYFNKTQANSNSTKTIGRKRSYRLILVLTHNTQ